MRTAQQTTRPFLTPFTTSLTRLVLGATAIGLSVSLMACSAQSEDYVGEAFDCISAAENGNAADHDVVVLIDRHPNGDVTGYFGSTYFTTGKALMVVSEIEDVETDDGLQFESETRLGEGVDADIEVELESKGTGELEGEITYSINGTDVTCDIEVELE